MTPLDLREFLGQQCHIVVHCRACGRQHARFGRLRPGAWSGEVTIQGLVYRLDDIVSISTTPEPMTVGRGLGWLIPYLSALAALLTWLRLAHR